MSFTSSSMERLGLDDTPHTAILKLAEGNPGALRACCELSSKSPSIDPKCAFGPYGPLLSLDSFGIYGQRIWMLFNDVCDRNVENTLGLLRAVQLGLLGARVLNHAINNRGGGIDVGGVVEQVKQQLESFGKAE